MKPKGSLLYSHEPTTGPYPGSGESSPHPHAISFRSVSILSSNLHAVSFRSVSILSYLHPGLPRFSGIPTFCMHFLSLPCMKEN